MTMTEDAVRTYDVGDTPDEYVYRPNTDTWCRHQIGGFFCSIGAGHTGPQHVAAIETRVLRVVDRDQADDPVVTHMTEVPVTGGWLPGDLVMRTGMASRIGIGQVLSTDGGRVWLVARNEATDPWRLVRVDDPGVLMRHSGILAAPTIGEIGEALVHKHTALDEALTAAREGNEGELARTRQALLDARRETDEAKAAHEEFRERVVEVGGKAAEDNDWCSVFDDLMEQLGLPPRMVPHDVEITVTATRTITVQVDLPQSLRNGSGYSGDVKEEIDSAGGWTLVDQAFHEQESEDGWSTTDYEVESWSEA